MEIKISHLSFAYTKGGATVLNGLSFTVEHHQVTGILGSSGCGKSTLLRALCGILPNSQRNVVEGQIRYDGGSSLAELRRQGRIGLMFQDPSLLPNLTIEENVIFPLDMLGEKDSRTPVKSLIETVGLAESRQFLPKHLSGGMQTRAALARTFVTRPDLLLLDAESAQ